jgi:hypothetical protein
MAACLSATAICVGPGRLAQRLMLGPGTWEISLRYFSDLRLRFGAGPLRASLPAYVGDPSSYFGIGRVTTGERDLEIEVEAPRRRRLDVVRSAVLGPAAATRVDERGHLVPLRRACGAYVDWFRLGR